MGSMTVQEAKDYLRGKLQDYLISTGIQKAPHKNFICPSCGHGSKTPPASYDEKAQKVHCFSCNWTGDIFDIIGIRQHTTDFMEQLEAAAAIYGVTINGKTLPKDTKRPQHSTPTSPEKPTVYQDQKLETDYTSYVSNLPSYKNITEAAGYMASRGFTEDTDQQLLLQFVRYDQAKEQIIISYEPDQPRHYIGREIHGDKKQKPKGREPIFCLSDLYNSEGQPIYILEGQIDALSIKALGGKAVALCGTQNTGKLIEAIKKNKPSGALIVAMDNDAPGKAAQKKLLDELNNTKAGIKYIDGSGLFESYKDANEIFINEREALANRIKRYSLAAAQDDIEPAETVPDQKPTPEDLKAQRVEAEKLYRNSISAAGAMGEFDKAMNARANAPDIPTGFKYLDTLLDGGLYEGLYFIGAQTSVGKTTLVMQLADQLAAQGHDVLIFSLEMSKFELIARSISRETYKYNPEAASSTRQIMNFKWYAKYSDDQFGAIVQGREAYEKYADHVFILEGIGNIGTEEVRSEIDNHKAITGNTPIVIIDYIQLLAPLDVRMSDKSATDKNVLELKRISRDNKTPVIGISSLNRNSYADQPGKNQQEEKRVNLWSYKESGAIEYSNDILFGLNVEGTAVNDVQTMSLEVLKNRNGRRSTKDNKVITLFDYHQRFNYFEEKPSINGIQPVQKII